MTLTYNEAVEAAYHAIVRRRRYTGECPGPDTLVTSVEDVVTALEAFGLIAQPPTAEPKKTPREVIADVTVNDAFRRVEHGVPTLGDGYASRIVMALERAGYSIVTDLGSSYDPA